MGRTWFGTDGIRGVANERLSADLALRLGRAVALRAQPGAEILVGRDTRRSGPMLMDAVCAGIASAGGTALRLGVLPTPAVAWAVRTRGARAGIVISASHNPFPDNGLKVFGPDGFKLGDEAEEELEELLESTSELPTGGGVGTTGDAADATGDYAAWVAEQAGVDLTGMRIVVDCAHGAATPVAAPLFAALGASAHLTACTPDGVNINVDCGSTHLGHVAAAVRERGADLGVAFDGDADRVLLVDGEGRAVDGDHILAILAEDLLGRDALTGRRVVLTSMANLGAHRALERLGCAIEVTDVGDRYVLEAMRRDGAVLGGEQSGHVIALDRQTTGDGPLTAVLVLAALRRSGRTLEEAAGAVEKYPQRLVSVPARRDRLAACQPVWDAVAAAEAELGRDGRVVLRASGTEELVRVMVEAPDDATCQRLADGLVEIVRRELAPAR